MKLSREELMKLSCEERLEYNKRMNAERVARYRAGNQEKVKEYSRVYKKEYIKRPENVEKYKAKSREYVKKHREAIENKKEKAVETLTDAIRNKKAREELKKLQKDKAKAEAEAQAPKKRGRKSKNPK